MIDFGGRTDDCRRSVRIGPLDRRDAFRQHFPGIPSIRSSSGHFTEINMTGSRQHIYPIVRPPGRFMSRQNIIVHVEHLYLLLVGIIIIVTVFRSMIHQLILQLFESFEIVRQSFLHSLHRDGLFIIHMIA